MYGPGASTGGGGNSMSVAALVDAARTYARIMMEVAGVNRTAPPGPGVTNRV